MSDRREAMSEQERTVWNQATGKYDSIASLQAENAKLRDERDDLLIIRGDLVMAKEAAEGDNRINCQTLHQVTGRLTSAITERDSCRSYRAKLQERLALAERVVEAVVAEFTGSGACPECLSWDEDDPIEHAKGCKIGDALKDFDKAKESGGDAEPA